MLFSELGLSEPTLRAVAELGYEEPTPIQERAIPQILKGVDIIAQAQTGTGKTGAFALPIIDVADASDPSPQALVLTPTRELAMQVAEAFHSYSKYRGITTLPIYGGQPIDRQLRALQRGVQVVVGTPGRVLDHISRGTLRLDHVKTVVLDEADEMLAMGFIEDVEEILRSVSADRQTALFSATMPRQIVDLAERTMKSPIRVTIESKAMTVPQVRQVYYEVGGRDKFEVLARILDFETPISTIIFCRTRGEVDSLGERLNARAMAADTLHGELSQVQRDRVMGRFRAGQVEILVATDVAARGLDVEQVTHVINYDIPLDPEVYVHRIGRTGRAGRSGTAVTLIKSRERALLRSIERAAKVELQRLRLPTVADLQARRRETFKDTLRETIGAGELDFFQTIVDELGEEYGPSDLAAAAFKLLMGPAPTEADLALERAEPDAESRDARRGGAYGERSYGDRSGRGGYGSENRGGYGGESRGRGRDSFERDNGPEPGMTRLFLAVGRDDGVRPADIVGAIANEADISGRAIGMIQLYDRFAFVEVPEKMSSKVLRALKTTMIRGRRLSPTLARPRE